MIRSLKNHRDFLPVLAREIKLVAVPAMLVSRFVLPHNVLNIDGWEKRVGSAAPDFTNFVKHQPAQCFVSEYHSKLIVNDDDALPAELHAHSGNYL
jgi:hypothetical protein